MERWSGIFKVPISKNSTTAHYNVAASLCLSSASKRLVTPSANVIFFNGDRVEGTGNPVIERLSDPQTLAEIQVSKFGDSVNAWVIEASTFNGPFAVYKHFISSLNSRGDPKSYNPDEFPASMSTFTLLLHCLEEAKNIIEGRQEEQHEAKISTPCSHLPKTIVLGFSKGGIILNQLVTELGISPVQASGHEHEDDQIIPRSKESFLTSICEIHYVDVGLNSKGAYLTDADVIKRIAKRLTEEDKVIRFFLHGTPRQWSDSERHWIKHEKDKLMQIIESEAHKSGGKIQACEKFYLADKPTSMQMQLEIIDKLNVD